MTSRRSTHPFKPDPDPASWRRIDPAPIWDQLQRLEPLKPRDLAFLTARGMDILTAALERRAVGFHGIKFVPSFDSLVEDVLAEAREEELIDEGILERIEEEIEIDGPQSLECLVYHNEGDGAMLVRYRYETTTGETKAAVLDIPFYAWDCFGGIGDQN